MKSLASHEQGVNASEQSKVQWLVSNHENVWNAITMILIFILASTCYFRQAGLSHFVLAYLIYESVTIFTIVSTEFNRISAHNSKLVEENKKLAEDNKRLSNASQAICAAEKKRAIDVEVICHDKVDSKIANPSKSISPQTIAFNSSSFDQPLCVFHANAEEEKDNEYDEEEYGDDYDDVGSQSEGYETDSAENQKVCSWDDFQPREFLTFYLGNLHFSANTYQVKRVVQEAIGLKSVPVIDQVVIARTSNGESRGCAFVTVCWDKYFSIDYDCSKEFGDEIPDNPREYDESLQDQFCRSAGHKRICGRRVFVEVARNQRRN